MKPVLPGIVLSILLVGLGACSKHSETSSTSTPLAPLSGRQLYEHHGCALCHGPEGRGHGPVSATLDPPPRDLRDPATYRIGSTEVIIATTIEQGILVFGGSGMTPFAHIPAEERLELARYIVSLQEPVHEPVSEPGGESADES